MDIQITPAMVETLTVGEIETIEERTGRAIGDLFDEGVPKGTVLRSLAFIIRRRRAIEAGEPIPTWDDTYDDLVTVAEDEEVTTGQRPPSSARRKPRGG